jgi:Na+/H+-dicarboxylate symporter
LPRLSFTFRVLAGLAGGLAIGIGISAAQSPWLHRIPGLVAPVGALFVSGIRMTVIPLVVSNLIVGIASMRDARSVARLGTRSLALFLALLLTAGAFSAAWAVPLLGRLRIDPAVAAFLRADAASGAANTAESARQVPSLSQWLIDLVPVNVFKAAADGAILPLIVFAVAFGMALLSIEEGRRATVLRFFQAVADAMLLIVGWVVSLTPLGVFALTVPLGARMGFGAAGALAYYVGLLCGVTAAFVIAVLYPVAILVGRVPLSLFTKACAAAQAIAFSSRSSLAALPASIKGAREILQLPDEIGSFLLPLAASAFRPGATMVQVVGVLFLARLYGIELEAVQVVTVIATAVLTTLTVPGIPAGGVIVMAPVLLSVGVPVDGIAVLIGVDSVPDMFRTLANVTAWLTAATVMSRGASGGEGPATP